MFEGFEHTLVTSVLYLLQLIDAVGGVKDAVTPEGYHTANQLSADMGHLQLAGQYLSMTVTHSILETVFCN